MVSHLCGIFFIAVTYKSSSLGDKGKDARFMTNPPVQHIKACVPHWLMRKREGMNGVKNLRPVSLHVSFQLSENAFVYFDSYLGCFLLHETGVTLSVVPSAC